MCQPVQILLCSFHCSNFLFNSSSWMRPMRVNLQINEPDWFMLFFIDVMKYLDLDYLQYIRLFVNVHFGLIPLTVKRNDINICLKSSSTEIPFLIKGRYLMDLMVMNWWTLYVGDKDSTLKLNANTHWRQSRNISAVSWMGELFLDCSNEFPADLISIYTSQ